MFNNCFEQVLLQQSVFAIFDLAPVIGHLGMVHVFDDLYGLIKRSGI